MDVVYSNIARKLAANETRTRNKTLRKLRSWLARKGEASAAGLPSSDCDKLWKALFYCMWHSDKPPVQREVADNLAQLINVFQNTDSAVVWFRSYLQELRREWHGIDRLRMDKYYLLVRLSLRHMFTFCSQRGWDALTLSAFLKALSDIPLSVDDQSVPDGLRYHLTDSFWEEFEAAVRSGSDSRTRPSAAVARTLLEPFVSLLQRTRNRTLFLRVADNVIRRAVEKPQQEDDDDEEEEEEKKERVTLSAVQIGELLLEGAEDAEGTVEANRTLLYKLRRELLREGGISATGAELKRVREEDEDEDEEDEEDGEEERIVERHTKKKAKKEVKEVKGKKRRVVEEEEKEETKTKKVKVNVEKNKKETKVAVVKEVKEKEAKEGKKEMKETKEGKKEVKEVKEKKETKEAKKEVKETKEVVEKKGGKKEKKETKEEKKETKEVKEKKEPEAVAKKETVEMDASGLVTPQGTPAGKKRVRISLKSNKSQNFLASLSVDKTSPAFTPEKKPERGVLKPFRTPQIKKKIKLGEPGRSRGRHSMQASDFF